MIVPAMTYKEIYHQLMEDYEALSRKAYAQAIIFQKEMLRKKLRCEVRVVTYKTAQHNEWNIIFRIFTNDVEKIGYLRTYDKVGPVTYHIMFYEDNTKHLIKQNTHFYQRYNERMKLNLSKPADVIKHFFKHNMELSLGLTEVLENGQKLMQFVYTGGMGIGWFSEEAMMVHMKTFISNDILTAKQKNLVDFIKHHEDGEEFEQVINRKHLKNDF
jgi:hypothetical protein